MEWALINGQRHEAQPYLSGECPACGRSMVAKCGEVRIHHWAHQQSNVCDPGWKNETEWHRAWKEQFPADWQELVQRAETGERHIADVNTPRGWVIEFQHSYLKPEERRSRDTYYPQLIWVVDGTRRRRDIEQFGNVWQEGIPVGGNQNLRKTFSNSAFCYGNGQTALRRYFAISVKRKSCGGYLLEALMDRRIWRRTRVQNSL